MRLVWATDIHLNFLRLPSGPGAFGEYCRDDGDALLITGDISEAPTLVKHLEALANGFGKPIYFVLGNHDYYGGSFYSVHSAVFRFGQYDSGPRADPNLTWLRNRIIELAPDTALVGHEGWYDAQLGDPHGSTVVMHDWIAIRDLAPHYFSRAHRAGWSPGGTLISTLRQLGDDAAAQAEGTLRRALTVYPRIIFATHFPPFAGACWHEGQMSSPEFLPWFTCKAMGDMLRRVAKDNPTSEITVLCGHTHSRGDYHAALNLTVHTGGAAYGHPTIAKVFDL